MMPAIALHPLDVPVLTLEQAQAAQASMDAWLSMRYGPVSHRVLQPMQGQWPADEKEHRAWMDLRLTEAMVLLMWEDLTRARALPEQWDDPRALPADIRYASRLEINRFDNGPDDAVSGALVVRGWDLFPGEAAAPSGALVAASATHFDKRRREASERLRAHWEFNRKTSALCHALFIMANRPKGPWHLEISSLAALQDSALGPAWRSARAQEQLDTALPASAASAARPRL